MVGQLQEYLSPENFPWHMDSASGGAHPLKNSQPEKLMLQCSEAKGKNCNIHGS